jgi:hypothetical protein
VLTRRAGRGALVPTERSRSDLRRTVPGVECGRTGGDGGDWSVGSATTDPAVAALWPFAARLPRARAPSFPVRRLTRTSRGPCSQHLRQGLLDQGWNWEHGKSTHRRPRRRMCAPNDGRHAWAAAPDRHISARWIPSWGCAVRAPVHDQGAMSPVRVMPTTPPCSPSRAGLTRVRGLRGCSGWPGSPVVARRQTNIALATTGASSN